jgi:hypothetical protein
MRSASTVNGSRGPTGKMSSPRSPSKDQVTANSSPGVVMVAVPSARISMTELPGSSGGPQFQVPTIEAAPPGVGEAACWVPGVHATQMNASAVRPICRVLDIRTIPDTFRFHPLASATTISRPRPFHQGDRASSFRPKAV